MRKCVGLLETCVRAALDADVPGIEEIGRRTWPATYRSLGDTTVLVATADDELVVVANVDMRVMSRSSGSCTSCRSGRGRVWVPPSYRAC
jgi:hypothetical protein